MFKRLSKTAKSIFIIVIVGLPFGAQPGYCGKLYNYVSKIREKIKTNKLSKDKRYKENPTYQKMTHEERAQLEKEVRTKKEEDQLYGSKSVRSAEFRDALLKKQEQKIKIDHRRINLEKFADSLPNDPRYKSHTFYQSLNHDERVKVELAVDRAMNQLKGTSREDLRNHVLNKLEVEKRLKETGGNVHLHPVKNK